MGAVIAVSGKGGTGKSTLCACLIHSLAEAGEGPVLAIDADHNASLALLLGQEVESTISDIRNQTREAAQSVTEIPKERLLDQWLNEIIVESDGYDLIAMGRPEGPGCYCYVNNLLRRYLSLLKRNYPYVIIDNAAGMEHLSRLTSDDLQLLLLVSEPTYLGLTTVRRIDELTRDLPIKIGKRALAVNRVGPEGMAPRAREAADALVMDARFEIPYSKPLEDLSVNGEGFTPEAATSATRSVAGLMDLCREVAGRSKVKA